MKTTSASLAKPERVRVWDLPTRFFHWALVLVVLAAWGSTWEEWWLPYHLWIGKALVVLLLFRLGWGFWGNGFVRFRHFVTRPQEVWEFVRRRWQGPVQELGHNPAAGWMVLALLGVLTGLALTGLLTAAGQEQLGPLGTMIPPAVGSWAAVIHGGLAWLLVGLIVLHVLASIVESRARQQNLPWAMVTGFQREVAGVSLRARQWLPDRQRQRRFLLGVALFAVGLGWLPDDFHNPLTVQALQKTETTEVAQLYQEECAACHTGFHPGLLPQRSWEALFAGLEDHFGEDATLDDETYDQLFSYVWEQAAERQQDEVSLQILRSLAPEETPLRITDTPYWVARHQELDQAIFSHPEVGSSLQCAACHRYAEAGSFEDAHIRLPPPIRAVSQR